MDTPCCFSFLIALPICKKGEVFFLIAAIMP